MPFLKMPKTIKLIKERTKEEDYTTCVALPDFETQLNSYFSWGFAGKTKEGAGRGMKFFFSPLGCALVFM